MKVAKVSTELSGNTLYVPVESLSLYEELTTLVNSAKEDDIITIKVIDMSAEEYNKLPEFEGW